MNPLDTFKKKLTHHVDAASLSVSDLRIFKRARRRRILRYIGYALLGYLLLVFIVALFHVVQIGSVILHGCRGQSILRQAIVEIKESRFSDAAISSALSEKAFGQASASLHELDSSLLSMLPLVSSQITEATHLIDAVVLLNSSLTKGITFATELRSIRSGTRGGSFNTFTVEEKKAMLEKIYAATPELSSIFNNLAAANKELDQLKMYGIFLPVKYIILDAKDKLTKGTELLGEAVPLSHILPIFAGFPATSTFLVVLQNQDELRPTGGFIGTYGILQTGNGDIARFETHDVYHMDMPVKDQVNVTPPDPIRLYLNPKWYLRDANWSPDFPTAAQDIIKFYNLENQYLVGKNQINNFSGKFDGVIAINPGFIMDLLELVGPIAVGGETYTPENFTQLLEYKVEKGFLNEGVSSWQRKEVVGDIAKEIKIRLLNLPATRWPELIDVINLSFNKKKMLVWLADADAQELITKQNWGGDIKYATGDYLYLIDSNFASLKSDAVIDRALAYRVEAVDNRLKATLQITYNHKGKVADWRTSRYKNYMRIYVPKGSELIAFEGNNTQPVVSTEINKTVFGSLVYVELNSQKTIKISYYLPKYVQSKYENGEYSMLWQHQASSFITSAQFDVKLPNGVKSISQSGGEVTKTNSGIKWQAGLTTDQELLLNF